MMISFEVSESSSDTTTGANTPETGVSSISEELQTATSLASFVLEMVDKYRKVHHYKVAGAGITVQAASFCPELPSLLWRNFDIVCFIFKPFGDAGDEPTQGTESQVDEESDSVARKTIE
jgi:hypothetical protein